MGLETKAAIIVFIALMLGLIALYHVWLDRRDSVPGSATKLRAVATRPAEVGAPPDPEAGGPAPRPLVRQRRVAVRKGR